MYCEKLPEVKQLLIDNPARLEEGDWEEHVQFCKTCRMEIKALKDTLAVFCQLESVRLSQAPTGPSWDRLCSVLVEQEQQNAGSRFPMMAAAVVGAFMVGATATWMFLQPGDNPGMDLAKATAQDNRLETPAEAYEKAEDKAVSNSSKGVWGDLQINHDGTLEIVVQGNGLTEKAQKQSHPRWELSPPTPKTTTVSNR